MQKTGNNLTSYLESKGKNIGMSEPIYLIRFFCDTIKEKTCEVIQNGKIIDSSAHHVCSHTDRAVFKKKRHDYGRGKTLHDRPCHQPDPAG